MQLQGRICVLLSFCLAALATKAEGSESIRIVDASVAPLAWSHELGELTIGADFECRPIAGGTGNSPHLSFAIELHVKLQDTAGGVVHEFVEERAFDYPAKLPASQWHPVKTRTRWDGSLSSGDKVSDGPLLVKIFGKLIRYQQAGRNTQRLEIGVSEIVSSSFLVDTAAPQMTVIAPLDGSFFNHPRQAFEVAVEDSGSGINSDSILLIIAGAPRAHVWSPETGLVQWTPEADLPEGWLDAMLEVRDMAGNLSIASWRACSDRTPPEIDQPFPADGAWSAQSSQTISVGVHDALSGLAIWSMAVNGIAVEASLLDGRLSAPVQALADGAVVVDVSAEDFAGNRCAYSWSFGVDTVEPCVETIQPLPDSFSNNPRLAIAARASDAGSGIAHMRLTVDGEVAQIVEGPQDIIEYVPDQDWPEKWLQVEVHVADLAGNAETLSWQWCQDRTPWRAEQVSPEPGQWTNTVAPEVMARLVDDLSGIDPGSVALMIGGMSVVATPDSEGVVRASVPVDEGPVTVLIAGLDRAGNAGSCEWEFFNDRTPPDVSVIAPEGVVNTSRPEMVFAIDDALSGVAEAILTVGGIIVDLTPVDGLASWTPDFDLSEGEQIVRLAVRDIAGNVAEVEHSFGVELVPPPPPELAADQKPFVYAKPGESTVTIWVELPPGHEPFVDAPAPLYVAEIIPPTSPTGIVIGGVDKLGPGETIVIGIASLSPYGTLSDDSLSIRVGGELTSPITVGPGGPLEGYDFDSIQEALDTLAEHVTVFENTWIINVDGGSDITKPHVYYENVFAPPFDTSEEHRLVITSSSTARPQLKGDGSGIGMALYITMYCDVENLELHNYYTATLSVFGTVNHRNVLFADCDRVYVSHAFAGFYGCEFRDVRALIMTEFSLEARNSVFAGTESFLLDLQMGRATIVNNTFYSQDSVGVHSPGASWYPLEFANNIISAPTGSVNIHFDYDPVASVWDHNCWHGDFAFTYNSGACADFDGWKDASEFDQNSITDDPLFANVSGTDPAQWDFHLQSTAGRWDPAINDWVIDDIHSPCIDAGDPNSDLGDEDTEWHGGRINMGAYGGTEQASRTIVGPGGGGGGGGDDGSGNYSPPGAGSPPVITLVTPHRLASGHLLDVEGRPILLVGPIDIDLVEEHHHPWKFTTKRNVIGANTGWTLRIDNSSAPIASVMVYTQRVDGITNPPLPPSAWDYLNMPLERHPSPGTWPSSDWGQPTVTVSSPSNPVVNLAFTAGSLSEGQHWIKIEVVDEAGSIARVGGLIFVDLTAPERRSPTYSPIQFDADVYSLTVSVPDHDEYVLHGSAERSLFGDWSSWVFWPPLRFPVADASLEVEFTLEDFAGNTASESVSLDFRLDGYTDHLEGTGGGWMVDNVPVRFGYKGQWWADWGDWHQYGDGVNHDGVEVAAGDLLGIAIDGVVAPSSAGLMPAPPVHPVAAGAAESEIKVSLLGDFPGVTGGMPYDYEPNAYIYHIRFYGSRAPSINDPAIVLVEDGVPEGDFLLDESRFEFQTNWSMPSQPCGDKPPLWWLAGWQSPEVWLDASDAGRALVIKHDARISLSHDDDMNSFQTHCSSGRILNVVRAGPSYLVAGQINTIRVVGGGFDSNDASGAKVWLVRDGTNEALSGVDVIGSPRVVEFDPTNARRYRALEVDVLLPPDMELGIYGIEVKVGDIAVDANASELGTVGATWKGPNGGLLIAGATNVLKMEFVAPGGSYDNGEDPAADPIPTNMVGVSDARPVLTLDDVSYDNVTIGDSAATVTLSGVVRDPFADNVPRSAGVVGAGGADIKEVRAYVGATLAGTATLANAEDSESPKGFWKQYPYKGLFEDLSVSLPLKEGAHLIRVVTSENVAGLEAFDEVVVTLQKRVVPGSTSGGGGTVAANIYFAADMTAELADGIRYYYGYRDPILPPDEPEDAELLESPDEPASLVFSGTAFDTSTTITITDVYHNGVWTPAPADGAIAFDENSVERLKAQVVYSYGDGTNMALNGTFIETSASSRLFRAEFTASGGGGGTSQTEWTSLIENRSGSGKGSFLPATLRFQGLDSLGGANDIRVDFNGTGYALEVNDKGDYYYLRGPSVAIGAFVDRGDGLYFIGFVEKGGTLESINVLVNRDEGLVAQLNKRTGGTIAVTNTNTVSIVPHGHAKPGASPAAGYSAFIQNASGVTVGVGVSFSGGGSVRADDKLEIYDGANRDTRFNFAAVTGKGSITHEARLSAWPADNSGFGKRRIRLLYKTAQGTMVPVGEVPIELYFDAAAKKGDLPAWAVYWSADDGAGHKVCPLLTSDIKIVPSSSRGGAYWRPGSENGGERIEVLAGTGWIAEPWSFRFPIRDGFRIPSWSNIRRATWHVEERTDIVQMTIAHEMTHKKAVNHVLAGADDWDGDDVADTWEKALGWNEKGGQPDEEGLHRQADTFGAAFTGSPGSDGDRDQEFYAWISPAFSVEKQFGAKIEFKDGIRPVYHGVVPGRANHSHDWSYLGYNWNRQRRAGLRIAIEGHNGTIAEADGEWPSPAALRFTVSDSNVSAANIKSYKWDLSRVPLGVALDGETTATFTASQLEVMREEDEFRQPYGGFTVTVEIELIEPDEFGRRFITGAKLFTIVDRQPPPRLLEEHTRNKSVVSGADRVTIHCGFKLEAPPFDKEELADIAFFYAEAIIVDEDDQEHFIDHGSFSTVKSYSPSIRECDPFGFAITYEPGDKRVEVRYWTSDFAGNMSDPYVITYDIP